jgi:hypothetical protein
MDQRKTGVSSGSLRRQAGRSTRHPSAPDRPVKTGVLSGQRRKRNHISLKEKLAAALTAFLPPDFRRLNYQISAEKVIALFHFDHGILHALDGSDRWWNLYPMLVTPHREKSRRDTGIIAKIKRIEPRWKEFTANMARPDKGQPEKGERKQAVVLRCPHGCGFKIRSRNAHYVTVTMRRHLAKAHSDAQ